MVLRVWNESEPWTAFGTGKQSGLFIELYGHTVAAVKAVAPGLRVGGPATATNAWITISSISALKNQLPADFISTHHYRPTPSASRATIPRRQLSDSRRSVLPDQAREARREAGDRPLYYTEWSSSSNPRDPLHDEAYAATFVVRRSWRRTGSSRDTAIDLLGYFRGNYFPLGAVFRAGFGLLNIHGIAKPAYRAYELLHALGTRDAAGDGTHPTVDAWVVRDEAEITVLLTNFALPRHPIGAETGALIAQCRRSRCARHCGE